MRSRVLGACLVLALGGALVAPSRPALAGPGDFDPSGRGKKKPPKPGPGPHRPPGPAGPKGPKADDDGTGKDGKAGPNVDALIQRYTTIVLGQPSAPFPIQRLAQLYRERDGNLKKLVEDFEKRASGPGDTWGERVALAGIYKQDGRIDEAIKTYDKAIADKPKEPAAMMALAQLQADKGDKSGARATYEKALPLLKINADIEQTTRTLLALSLDVKDFAAAKKYHESLVKAAQSSLFVRAELGRELLARGYNDRAEVEFRDVVKAAAGDNRALAPALRDLGQSLARQKKTAEAMQTLKRALQVAGGAAGVRSEILMIMTEAFRAEGKLPELVALLEQEHGQDFQRVAMMGSLYEEIGEVDKAIVAYKKALSVDGKHIDTRLKLVHLLQTAGDLDGAIREYEALIKAAPNNPDFVFELCETLIQRGDRPKALKLLNELEARAHDADILTAVADFYERVEEKDRALRVLQKLASTGGGDPSHLIDLGDRYFQAGDKKKAMETWARIKGLVQNRAKAAATLGEVYLDHDMATEALASMREAVQLEPNNGRFKKSLATALERTATSLGNPNVRYVEARQIWEQLLAESKQDKALAREARTHIVSLWGLTRELANQVSPLANKFAQKPPDLEAGRLLAEVLRKLHRLPEAEATLRKVVTIAPGDEESLLALERVLVQEQNLNGAIEVLAKLVEVDPKRARELYQRMAQYAAELYHDDDAIKFAARAVELSPDDANGHQKLGDMYRRRQDPAHAVAEYRQAIAKNDRLFPVYFDLGELLLSTGQTDEADRLFRRVVRASTDEELVARAARMSMQINLGKGTLQELERELLPVAVGNPQKTIYRRLLVELYGAMTFPLVQKVKSEATDGSVGKARAELAKIGARAVKPLLDALADEKESQQKIAIEVLAYVENKGAGPSLYNFATGNADKSLRVRAMIACGALKDPALLSRYEQLLVPREGAAQVLPSDALAVAAAWAVARMNDKKAEALTARLLASPSPDVRALAAVSLGLGHDKRHAAALATMARAPESGPLSRAAAAFALAELGASGDAGFVLSLADAHDPWLRRAALLAVARLGKGEDATKPGGVADAIGAAAFATDEGVRATAVAAATVLTTRSYKRTREALPVPDGPLVVRDVILALSPDPASARDREAALVALAPAIQRAAVAAVATSPERGRVVADALLAGGDKPGLAPFTDPGRSEGPSSKAVDEAIEALTAAVIPGFVALVRHPDVDVRTRAVELLARRSEPAAQTAVVDALGDPDESVRRAALAAVGAVKSPSTMDAVARIVRSSPSWPLRVRAAEALGRLGAGASTPVGVDTLAVAAKSDTYALVRESAMRALWPLDRARATPVLRDLAATDPEPRVRETATELLAGPPKR